MSLLLGPLLHSESQEVVVAGNGEGQVAEVATAPEQRILEVELAGDISGGSSGKLRR